MNDEKLNEISIMPQWKILKELMAQEINKVCDLKNLDSLEELVGAKFCKKVFEEIVRKIDGAEDSLTFNK